MGKEKRHPGSGGTYCHALRLSNPSILFQSWNNREAILEWKFGIIQMELYIYNETALFSVRGGEGEVCVFVVSQFPNARTHPYAPLHGSLLGTNFYYFDFYSSRERGIGWAVCKCVI